MRLAADVVGVDALEGGCDEGAPQAPVEVGRGSVCDDERSERARRSDDLGGVVVEALEVGLEAERAHRLAEPLEGNPPVFKADSVLAKHDETYMPKDVADRLQDKGVTLGGKEVIK